MSSHMNINGLRIDADGDKITIDLSGRNPSGKTKEIISDKDGIIKGDVEGNITATANNLTIIIEGDVMGNIIATTVKR